MSQESNDIVILVENSEKEIVWCLLGSLHTDNDTTYYIGYSLWVCDDKEGKVSQALTKALKQVNEKLSIQKAN